MFGFLKSKDDPAAPAAATPAVPRASWGERLKAGLSRTRDTLNTPLTELFSRAKIDDELLEDLETTLLMADCGVEATHWLLAELKAAVKRERLETPAQLRSAEADPPLNELTTRAVFGRPLELRTGALSELLIEP